MWFSKSLAYTITKYGMSMCVLGISQEYRGQIGVNALWPKTAIATAAVEMLLGENSSLYSRKPEICADAAYAILSRDPKTTTGNFFIDEDVVKEAGVPDLTQYACHPENADNLIPDGFLDIPFNKNIIWSEHEKPKFPTTTSRNGEVESLFREIERNLNESIVQRVNAIYQFNVQGDEPGTWFLNLKYGKGSCGRGDGGIRPEAILIMDSKDVLDLFSGQLKATSAYMSGKLKIDGDLQKAIDLEKFMRSFNKRL